MFALLLASTLLPTLSSGNSWRLNSGAPAHSNLTFHVVSIHLTRGENPAAKWKVRFTA